MVEEGGLRVTDVGALKGVPHRHIFNAIFIFDFKSLYFICELKKKPRVDPPLSAALPFQALNLVISGPYHTLD